MRKRGRSGSLPCATIAGVTAALIGAAGLGAQSQSTQPENTPARPVTYLWQGRIEVENDYNGEAGEHRWTAQYQVKFLEEQTSERHSYIDSFEVYEIVPLELKYTIHARQDWDRAGVGRGADGQILSGPVRMHGQATGIISADQMKAYQFLSGDIGVIEAPADSASTNQRAFASDREYDEFWNNHRTSPGWYRLNISFGGGNAGEQRARYNGINRSGEQPIGHDPDVDFVSWVPSFMPAGTNVIGRLDTPDQTDVRGEISLRYRDNDPELVKVKWSFVRCREGVPCPSPPSTDCRDPRLSSGYYERDPFGRETPADIAPSCEFCPGGTWKLNLGQVTFHPTERSEFATGWSALWNPGKVIPQCAYTYESIWTCTATGEVAKMTKTKITDGYCQPKG